MNMTVSPENFSLANAKEQALIERSKDAAAYIGPIDMDAIQKSYEDSFERLSFRGEAELSFEEFMTEGENFQKIVMTAHPTFFKSAQEAGLLSRLFTARAMNDDEHVTELEAQISSIQAKHPYKDPSTDEEGELLYRALKNTIAPGIIMQKSMMAVAQRKWPEQWKDGHYSPFNRNIWQKHDRDGRKIPVNVQLGEGIRQRRLGMEWLYIPQFKALLNLDISEEQRTMLNTAIEKMQVTARLYRYSEKRLATLDEENINLEELQNIIDELQTTKAGRITHPDQLTQYLKPILRAENTTDETFAETKIIHDNLETNGLCFSTPTHRVNAKDVHNFVNVERKKKNKGDLRRADTLDADEAHFDSIEGMIAVAKNQFSGKFTDTLKALDGASDINAIPVDGKPVHEMMLIRRFVYDAIDSHTVEKVDIAEAHNAMTQRGLRLAAKLYGISELIDIGLLHEDHIGIDNAYEIYSRLLKSDQYLEEISHTVPGTNKKRPRIALKIGYSDFAKQHSSPGGKPYNERCLLQIMKAIKDADLAGKVDLDIEFAGGEGPGRRVNLQGYEWTLKETITPAVLSYAAKNNITIKYRETIQGGDGAILLGTEESAAKIMATQLEHLSTYTSQPPEKTWDPTYFKTYASSIKEHHLAARDAYHAIYNDDDFALLIKLHKEMGVKGGSRKLDRGDLLSEYDKPKEKKPPLADFRAIGFNAASIISGAHVSPILGQGTAFYETMERTEKIVKSSLFRERMISPFMVRDLHVMDELKGFAELYNPDYWHSFGRFDENGNETIEAQIAKRVEEMVYKDDSQRRIYPRLKRAIRLLENDLERFDQIRERFDFEDVEAIINKGDYQERLAGKRALISSLHQNRLALLKQGFIKREEMALHSPLYSRETRSNAIKAGTALDFKTVSKVFDPALPAGAQSFKALHQEIIDHAIPLLVLAGNA